MTRQVVLWGIWWGLKVIEKGAELYDFIDFAVTNGQLRQLMS
jgi:hypothetical protein